MKPLTLEWVDKAEEDFRVAAWLQREPVGSPNAICFHCQQCVEKYLKALLYENSVPFPRTHDLDVLLDLLTGGLSHVGRFRDDLKFVNQFSVETRYPGVSADVRDATEALAIAAVLRSEVRGFLGTSDAQA